MNKPTIEQTLDQVEKHWDTDRTEATKAILRFAEGQREHQRTLTVEEVVEELWQSTGLHDFDRPCAEKLIKSFKEQTINETIKTFQNVVDNQSYEWDGGQSDWEAHIKK